MGAIQMRVILAVVVIGCFLAMAYSSPTPGEMTTEPVPPPNSRGSHGDSHSGPGSYSYSYGSRSRQKRFCLIRWFCGGDGGEGGSGSGAGSPGAPGGRD